MSALEPHELAEFLDEPVDPEEVFSEAIAAWDSCPDGHIVDRTLQFYTRLYLQDDILTKVDRASMLHSLEVRSPFLDIELVDFVRRLPWDFKLRGGQTKFLLRRALQDTLPREILDRPKKGFGVPMGRWLKAGVPPFDKIEPLAAGTSERFLTNLLQEHRAGKTDHRLFLYPHWLLTRWLKKHARAQPTI